MIKWANAVENYPNFLKKVASYEHKCDLHCPKYFSKDAQMRNITLNSKYFTLFKNPRDKCQIVHLSRQMYPENTKFLLDDATAAPYLRTLLQGYDSELVCCLKIKCMYILRDKSKS